MKKKLMACLLALVIASPASPQPTNVARILTWQTALDVAPLSSGADGINLCSGNTETRGESVPVFGRRSDSENFICGKFCNSVALAPGLPSLGSHVGHIFGASPDEQMLPITAKSHVAGMAYMHPDRDRSSGQFPSDPMSVLGFLGYSNRPVTADRKLGGSPEPTFVRAALIYLAPKALFKGKIQPSHVTSLRSCGEKRGMELQLPRVSYFNTREV